MYILGISNAKDSGAVLLRDGHMICAVNEERFNREKLTRSFPSHSIKWILESNNLTVSDIDAVGVGHWKGMSQELFYQYMDEALTKSRDNNSAVEAILERIHASKASDSMQRELFEEGIENLGLDVVPRYVCSHHHAHALTAFEFSPYDKALVVTLDGRGDHASGSVSIMERGKTPELLRVESEINSLGYFYGWITNYLGFIPDRHEGKVTGLAANGNPAACIADFEDIFSVVNGEISTNLGEKYRPHMRAELHQLKLQLDRHKRVDVAAAAQKLLEDTVCKYVEWYLSVTGLDTLCVSGGIFANVLLNMQLKDMDGVKSFFVYPHMGDGGIAAGGAAYAAIQNGQKISPLDTLYLGPSCNEHELETRIANFTATHSNIHFDRPDQFSVSVAEALDAGKVVGLYQSGMEYGPRALGARSILVRATDKSINTSLNKRLSRTETMPFAPVTLEEEAGVRYAGWTNGHINTRYMTCCYHCTPLVGQETPAIMHVDKTARPQIINSESHGVYYEILRAYFELTGIPTLINTSFNRHEEPIVNTVEEALSELKDDSIDILAMPPFILTK